MKSAICSSIYLACIRLYKIFLWSDVPRRYEYDYDTMCLHERSCCGYYPFKFLSVIRE